MINLKLTTRGNIISKKQQSYKKDNREFNSYSIGVCIGDDTMELKCTEEVFEQFDVYGKFSEVDLLLNINDRYQNLSIGVVSLFPIKK